MSPDVRRSADRATTVSAGITTRHAFAFGRHYDPDNTSLGPLVLHDEHRLDPGAGFPSHTHRDLEIVTWVLAGALRHEDDLGDHTVLTPGQVQRLTAGRGVRHAERNASGNEPLRFVQAWLLPDERDTAPTYACRNVEDALVGGGLIPVAGSGAAIGVGCRGATLQVARLEAATQVPVPAAPRVHLHVVAGSVGVRATHRVGAVPTTRPDWEGRLDAGDALRLTGAHSGTVQAVRDAAEVLIWSLPQG